MEHQNYCSLCFLILIICKKIIVIQQNLHWDNNFLKKFLNVTKKGKFNYEKEYNGSRLDVGVDSLQFSIWLKSQRLEPPQNCFQNTGTPSHKSPSSNTGGRGEKWQKCILSSYIRTASFSQPHATRKPTVIHTHLNKTTLVSVIHSSPLHKGSWPLLSEKFTGLILENYQNEK